jgi:hypothetical protein
MNQGKGEKTAFNRKSKIQLITTLVKKMDANDVNRRDIRRGGCRRWWFGSRNDEDRDK